MKREVSPRLAVLIVVLALLIAGAVLLQAATEPSGPNRVTPDVVKWAQQQIDQGKALPIAPAELKRIGVKLPPDYAQRAEVVHPEMLPSGILPVPRRLIEPR